MGKKSVKVAIMDPSTGLQMDHAVVCLLYKLFFANLTKDYPKVSEDWLELLCQFNTQVA